MSEENTDQNTGGSNNSANPSFSSSVDGSNTENPRSSRNVTVTIQYSYLTPDGLANLTPNGLASLAFPNGNIAPSNNPNISTGTETNGNADVEGSTVARPDGALVLSFSDVPSGTPQERLESIVSIAAELAMRRFSDMVSQSKGITKEQFERLAVLRVDDLPDKERSACSICYENYEDEVPNVLKRSRDSEQDDNSVKKQRSESPAIAVDRESHGEAERGSQPFASSSNTNNNETEESTPSYKHCPVRLSCGHIFGQECLYRWSRLENSCPLCRAPLVELSSEEHRESNNSGNNASAEVFERIRQLVYSPTVAAQEHGQAEQGEQLREAENSNSNDNGDEINPATESRPFSFSRSGIVFLGPDPHNPATTPASNDTGARPVDSTFGTNGSEPGNANRNVSSVTDNDTPAEQTDGNNAFHPIPFESRRIQWIPIPITTIRLGGNEGNQANASNNENNQTAHGERLRSILDRIFNITHAENTRNQESSSSINAEGNSRETMENGSNLNSEETNVSTNIGQPRRRSFLQNILRITNRSRNRPRNDINRTNPDEDHERNVSHQHNVPDIGDMFSSGVASYRAQNGRVSTFNIGQGPLPMPPPNTHSNSSNVDTQDLSNETQPHDPDSSGGNNTN